MFLKYNLRSLWNRRAATGLTVFSMGATVAVVAGVLALERGFSALFQGGGRDDVVILMRKGATNESESLFPRERADLLMKSIPGVAMRGEVPMASAETYLAVRLEKKGLGGETNVPIRGVQPMSLELLDSIRLVEGDYFDPGTDQVIVGAPLAERIQGCQLGEVMPLNGVPFEVVGVFDCAGPTRSEIWGDLDRLSDALQRPGCTRVIAKLEPGTDVEELEDLLNQNPGTQAKVLLESEYLGSQTRALSGVFFFIGIVLVLVMGAAAVFTGVNTMLSAVSARTREVGILMALGFRPPRIFFSFLTEAAALGLIGGVIGCLLALPLNGMQTGTTNWQTFTEVAFAFQVTPSVLLFAVSVSVLLGVAAGTLPALRASRMAAVDAIRR